MAGFDVRVDRRTALMAGAGVLGGLTELGLSRRPAEADTLSSGWRSGARQSEPAIWKEVDAALGKEGEEMPGGVYTYSLGREDVKVTAEGIHIMPSFALSADLFFMRSPAGVIVMGEIPVLEKEVNQTISRVFERGMQLTALHNHRIEMAPHIMWVHFMGQGAPAAVGAAVKYALPQSGAVFSKGGKAPQQTPLPAQQLGQILAGDVHIQDGGVVEVDVDREDTIKMGGMTLPPAFGVSATLYFQPLGGGRAALEAETPLMVHEVNGVSRLLRRSGQQITALHNHMLNEQPRLFYLHTWAVGDALALARATRIGMNAANYKPGNVGLGKG